MEWSSNDFVFSEMSTLFAGDFDSTFSAMSIPSPHESKVIWKKMNERTKEN
jgi:hypothetical protein